MADNLNAVNQYQRPDPSDLEKQKQAIKSVEYVFDSLMPGTFTVITLIEAGDIISNAIITIRNSNKQLGLNEDVVLKGLRQARKHIQLAIDEFETARSNRSRYQYIELANEKLRDALSSWEVH